jgi:hypothetical protein
MNQDNAQRWAGANGVYQDGAVIIQFDDHWEDVFIGFASQAFHTEDGPDNAGQPIPRHGYLTWSNFLSPEVAHTDRVRDDLADSPVWITEAHITPPQTVTLTDRGNQGVDVNGWRIVNKAGAAQILPPWLRIDAGGSLAVEVPDALLSAWGGTITLLNAQGLKVHGVSYTRDQVQDGTAFFLQDRHSKLRRRPGLKLGEMYPVDILNRRFEAFVLWAPEPEPPFTKPPELVLGRVEHDWPHSFRKVFKRPLSESRDHPDLWELDPRSDLTDGMVYHYWFEIEDSSPDRRGAMCVTDPLAFTVAHTVAVDQGEQSQLASVVKYQDSKFRPCNINGP